MPLLRTPSKGYHNRANGHDFFHLAWHKRGRFTCTCREVLNQAGTAKFLRALSVCLSVITFENLLKALQHLFVIFFDDMIEQKEVTQKSHVRLLCYGILWTVSEEKAYFMSESEEKGGTVSCLLSRLNFGACQNQIY